ncbi:MAG: type II toxin-antitoxin system HicA family toxin [Deltaproteobacteria bacterium]|nr:type II toxin-antitoxin system HicA family toxin [Deltaproteobacteria bacterium]
MSPKFPAVTSDEIILILEKIDFRLKRQSGSSHAIYFRDRDRRRTTVPIHSGKIIKRKTLKSILADAGLTLADFIQLRQK